MSKLMTCQYNAFLHQYAGVYAESTHRELYRRYARITRDLDALGIDSYADLDANQVKTYSLILRDRKMTDKARLHDLGSLGVLCAYYGNSAVDQARLRYPALFHSPRSSRLPPLTDAQTSALLQACFKLTHSADYLDVRAGGAVALAYGAGLRTLELQNATIDGIDLLDATLRVEVVKGGLTYGEPRTIPILPSTRAIIGRFLDVRAKQPPTVAQSPFLFANPATGAPLCTNKARRDKCRVENLALFEFDYRILRRSYAQRLIDEGAPLSAVSVVMGHNSTQTTERAYARIRPDSAIAQIREVF